MALPITPTPILKGDDSRRFNEEIAKSQFKKISQEDRKRGIELVKTLFKNSNLQNFMSLSDFRIERLKPEFDLSYFDCGDDDLNDFLISDANNYQFQLLAVTYLLTDINNKTLAFFSLSNDSLKDQDFEKWNSLSRKIPNRKRRKDYPAVKIVRLGVDKSLRGQKIGSEIVFF